MWIFHVFFHNIILRNTDKLHYQRKQASHAYLSIKKILLLDK